MEKYCDEMIGEEMDEIIDDRTIEDKMYEDFINSKNNLGPANSTDSLAPVYALKVIKDYATYANPLTYDEINKKVEKECFIKFDIKKMRRVVNTLILADNMGVVSKDGENKFYYFPAIEEKIKKIPKKMFNFRKNHPTI